jgi:CRP/FNR family transcriptional regulator, cyclic AMP receptor protein
LGKFCVFRDLDQMNHVLELKKTFLFKDFPSHELEKLAMLAKYEKYSTDSVLFREGESGHQLFVLLMGSVKVLKRDGHGVDEEVATLGSGSYFGEMAVTDGEHERSATIIAKESTELLVFAQAELHAMFDKDDRLAHHFYRALSRGLTRRLRATTQDSAFFRAIAKERHHHAHHA